MIREILRNSDDKTLISLLFANTTEEDILKKKEIDELAKKHSNLRVTYVVSKPSKSWEKEGKENAKETRVSGLITQELLKTSMPAPAEDISVYICGPPSFVKDICGSKTVDYKQGPVDGFLKNLGYNEDMVFKF